MNEHKFGNYLDDPLIKGLDPNNQEYAMQVIKNKNIAESYIKMLGGEHLTDKEVLERLKEIMKGKIEEIKCLEDEIKPLKMAIDMVQKRINEKTE